MFVSLYFKIMNMGSRQSCRWCGVYRDVGVGTELRDEVDSLACCSPRQRGHSTLLLKGFWWLDSFPPFTSLS